MSRVAGFDLAWLVLQVDSGVNVDVSIGEGLLGSATSTFLITLLVGAILVAVAPAYTQRMIETVREEPVTSFLYGLFFFLAFAVILLALFISFLGIPIALILGLLIALAWYVGDAIAFLAIADRLVDHDDGWLIPLLVAAGLNGGLVLTGIGGLLALLIGVAGFGAVVYDALD